jgi:hypothetical protein
LKTINFPRFHGGFFDRTGNLLFIIFFITSIAGCSEPDEVGLNLIDNKASFSTTDTITLSAYTTLSDSVITSLSYQNIFGVMNDPVFGKVKSEIFTEFRLPGNDFSLGSDPQLDSVVLYLGYTGKYYGLLQTIQTLRVYELRESIPDKDTLYSNLFIPHYSNHIGQRLLRPAPQDSVLVDSVMVAPHFSIRLDDAFGQKIIDANGTDAFRDITSFLDYFKGLYISVDDEINGLGSIFNINMYSFFTRLRLYYRDGDDTAQKHDFYISEFAKRFSYFKDFGFEGANQILLDQLGAQNPAEYGDSLLFVQSMGKVRTKITFPYLDELKKMPGLIINQASIIMPVASDFSDELFPEARQLLLYRLNAEGRLEFLSDMFLGEAYYGGIYSEADQQYKFNITRHLQQLLDGKISDHGMVLRVYGSAEGAERAVIKGPGRADDSMRLEIVYTTFE